MKHIILSGIFLFWASFAQAELTAQISEQQVTLDQSFKLILTQDSQQKPGLPNLVGLQKEFNILGTERSISYTLMNGQAHSVSQWTIILSPKKEGQLTIPAITINGQSTKPLQINVTSNAVTKPHLGSSTLDDQDGKEPVKLLTSISHTSPYINQEVIYTVKLLSNQNLLDAEYIRPKVEDALMIPLGNGKRYQTVENGQTYAVAEQGYAIFPQKSGKLTIQSPVLKALVYDVIPQRIQVKDKTLELNVKPIPADFKDSSWLPASKVSLTETYNTLSSTHTQGDTLERTITISSYGTPSQLIPKIEFKASDVYKIYPEKPQEHNVFRNDQLLGITTIKMTYLFSKAGKITIPEFQLPWFNTRIEKKSLARLPPKTLTIRPGIMHENKEKPLDHLPHHTEPKAQGLSHSSYTWLMAIPFALVSFLTMGLWFVWQKKNSKSLRQTKKAAWRALHLACQQNNPHQAKNALLDYAHLQWPEASFLNLSDLSKRIHDSQFKKQINLLSMILYSKDLKTSWSGENLWASFKAYKRMKEGKKSKCTALPPINPFN